MGRDEVIEVTSNWSGKWWVRITEPGDILAVTTDRRATKDEAVIDLVRVAKQLGRRSGVLSYQVSERRRGKGSRVYTEEVGI